jgi:hypothetical protein
MAAQALVDPESVIVARDEEGGSRFARGRLVVGDLTGSFLIDDDGYSIEFPAGTQQPPWSAATLQIAFEEELSRARGSHVTVRFHPREDEPAPDLTPEEEQLVGWSIGVSPQSGVRARALTLRALGDEWSIGQGESIAVKELPWIYTNGFDAWLALVKPYAGR